MKKLIKRISSMAVAVVMATSMVTSAGATSTSKYSWSVYKSSAPGMPSNISYYTNINRTYQNLFGATMNYFTSRCTSYSAGEDENGNSAYVRYWVYITDKDGNICAGTGSKYHYQKSTSSSEGTKSSITTSFKYGTTATVRYVVERNTSVAVSASMSGTYYFST